MYLAATKCGLPPALRKSEQKDIPLFGEEINTSTEIKGIGDNEAPVSTKISNQTTDFQKESSDDQQKNTDQSIENCTKSGTDITKEDNPQTSVQASVEPSGEESNINQQIDVQEPNELHKQLKHQDASSDLLHQQEVSNKKNETSTTAIEDESKQQNQRVSNNGLEEVNPVLVTTESKQNKTNTLKKYLPKTPQTQTYQATSLKDFHEDLPKDIKLQKQKSTQVVKLVLDAGEKVAESSNNLQLLESAKHNGQRSSETIHLPISTEEQDGSSSESPRGAEDPAQISSPEDFVSSKQESNGQEYFDPDLYARPEAAEDLVTTNNALDPKPSVTTYSGFTPSFPVRTAIPQYAVKEDHPDDLAPHHFAVNGHLPYVLDRAKFIQYQRTASRYPYLVRVPLQRNLNVPYPVLVERNAQSFSLPLKVLVHQPVVVQADDKVLYPATKPFSFRVHHGTPTSSEDEHDDVGQDRS